MVKKWYKSKTVWTNIIAIVAVLLSSQFNFQISEEETVALLAVINLILRAVTKEKIEW